MNELTWIIKPHCCVNFSHQSRKTVRFRPVLFNGKGIQQGSFHGWFPVPPALLWKWVRVGLWVGKWTHHLTRWAGVRSARKCDTVSLYTFPVFLIHLAAWVPVRKQKWSVTRACSCTNFKSHRFQPSKFFYNCHPIPRGCSCDSCWIQCSIKCYLFFLYRDGDIPASDNKGKH